MEIEVKSVGIDSRSITPALNILLAVEFLRDIEAVLSISGRLNVGNKTIAFLNEFNVLAESKIDLRILSDKGKNAIHNEAYRHVYYRPQLTAQLSEASIDHIEKVREKDHEKSVNFHFEFAVKFQTISLTPDHLQLLQTHTVPLVTTTTKNFNSNFTIKQSDWINHYSKELGIGNFMLLEFGIPGKENVIDEWVELYDRLYFRTKEIERGIREGDWQKAMSASRQFYENIKIGDEKPNHDKFVQSLKARFKTDQHSDEAFADLLKSFYYLFEFTSKYIHDKNKQQELKVLPIPYKEDAYLAFTLAVGILSLIGRKIREAD